MNFALIKVVARRRVCMYIYFISINPIYAYIGKGGGVDLTPIF